MTPTGIIARLNAEFRKALVDPGLAEKLAQHAQEPTGGSPEDLAATMKSESEKYAHLVTELGLAVQK